MLEDVDSTNHFTKEMIDMAVQLWTRSSISLIDVRYKMLHPDKPIKVTGCRLVCWYIPVGNG